MKEGFYNINYTSGITPGYALAVFDSGQVVGIDCYQIKYDGTYKFNNETNRIEAQILGSVPEGVTLGTGVDVRSFKFSVQFPRRVNKQPFSFDIPGGKVVAEICFLRDFNQ
jgi:hypothetical protein